jgi:hypothetical protein
MFLLRDLQSGFCESIRGDVPAELLDLIDEDGVSAAERLAIYRNNVMTRLTNALSTTYPVVRELVDPRFFAYAADAYIQRRFPADGCLCEYGADFPSFLAEFPPAASLEYLADVARLEWTMHRVLGAAVFSSVEIGVLTAFDGDPAGVRLLITPASGFLTSPYAIDEIWTAHRGGGVPSREWRLRRGPVHLQVTSREGLSMTALPPAIWEFRHRLADGQTLGESLVGAMAISPDFNAGAALAALFHDALVVGLTSDASRHRPAAASSI